MKRAKSPFAPQMRPLAERIAADELSLIGIGPQCASAGVIEALALRTRAYPFDWLFSSLPMVEHCLKDDFRAFLDPAQIEPVPVEARKSPTIQRADHRLYRDAFGVRHVFNHHDMPENLPHFERAVHKFRKAANPHLLHLVRGQPADLAAQVRAVAAAAKGKVIAVCVTHDPAATPAVRETARGPDWSIHAMTTAAPLQAVGFGAEADEEAFGRFLLAYFGLQPADAD